MSSNPYDEILKGYSPMSDTTDTSAYDAILTPTKKSPYDDIIQSAAQAHGLDPDLIRATMRQESTFKPNAKSPKGASGLMQLMPDTARTLGVKNIYDPKENIYGGAKYLKQQLDKFGGDVPKALAAYNAGPGAVVKYGDIPPYKETQDYVKRITGNYKGKGYANTPDPYESILSGYTPQQDTPPADIPRSAPPPTNPVDVMPTQTQLPPPPTPMGVNDQLMPEGLSTRPAPESPDTLKAQMQAALNPKVKDRSAVLTTEPSQNAIFQNSGFTPIQVQQGTLWVNPAKARKLKLRTPQDIQMFVENNPDGMTRLIGKVENVGDNTGGNQPVVHTTAPDGTELSSSVVTNPETAAKQVDVDKKSFPDSRTQITTTDQVALKRQQGTQATAPPQKVNFATSEPTISDVPQEPPTEVIDPKNEQQVNAATANLIKFPQTMKSVDDANAYIRSQLQALYPQGDFSKVNLLTPGAFGNGKDIGGVQATFGLLKNAGVDVAPLIAQKVAENRVENPTPDLSMKADLVSKNAKLLNDSLGTLPAGMLGSIINAGGHTANALAGLIRVIGDLNPAKLDSMAEASNLKPYRAGEDVVDYLKNIAETTNVLAQQTGQKYTDTATATDKGYLEGRPIERETWASKGAKAVGALADMPRIALMPGGLTAPFISFATDSALQAAAQGDKVDWDKVTEEGKKGAALGAVSMVAPYIGKAGDVGLATLLNRASSNLIKEGITMGTVGAGTYTASRALGDTPEQAFDNAVLFAAMHGIEVAKAAGRDIRNIPIRAKDSNGNEAVIKIDDNGKVETLDPTTQAKAQLVIPKPADKLSGDFASQPEKGFQITGGKSDNPAIVSPEENAAMLAKKATEPENITTNGSGGGSDSVEALNRLENEKNAGLKRVVVDTRSKTERPLIGVDAVDYTPKPHESIEYRGGGRNGEVIAQGDKVSPAYSPPERDVVKTETKPETKATEPDVYEINADELTPEKPAEKPIKEGSTVYNASGKEGEPSAEIKKGTVVYSKGDGKGNGVVRGVVESVNGKDLGVVWDNAKVEGDVGETTIDRVTTEAPKVEKPTETTVAEKPIELQAEPLAKGQRVTYLNREWEVAADPANGKVTLKDSTGRGKLVSVDKVLPAEGLPDTQIKDILGDEPVTPKNAMAKAEEIVNAEDQRSSSQNEGNVTANKDKSDSESSAEAAPIKRPSEELPAEVNAKGVTAEAPVKESGNDGGKSSESATGGEKPSAKTSEVPEALKVFEKNKIFTPDAVAKARERLAKKGTQFNAGLDPETLHDLGVIGGAYIEAGARNFGEFASKMKDDIKGISDDVLKQVYELVHKNYGDKIPNLEPPEGTKEVKQGERGSSKIGKSIEQKAIERGLTEGFPETAGYDKKYRDDQIQRVEKVITQDYDMARRMALGLEPIPHEVSPVMLLRGMEEVAKARKDVQLQYELANSPLVSETSRHAQEMRFMQEREQDSATTALQAIRRERIAQTQKVLKGRTVEEAIKQEAERLASTMKRSVEHVKRQIKTQGAWDKFLSEIEC